MINMKKLRYLNLLILFLLYPNSGYANDTSLNFVNRSSGYTQYDLYALKQLMEHAKQEGAIQVWVSLSVSFYADASYEQTHKMREEILKFKSSGIRDLIDSGDVLVLKTPPKLRNAPGVYLEASSLAILELTGKKIVRNIAYLPSIY